MPNSAATMAITTRSSISVNPSLRFMGLTIARTEGRSSRRGC